jgi:NAD(P)-dependent dehydrogenase (short-subunit alcohol dehydrogenase family)
MRSAKPAALVTGGAKGIGRAIVRHLISSGWQIGIVDLPNSGLRHAFTRARNVLAIEGDVRGEKTASHAVEAMMDRFGRLDGVVSNAGIMIRKPLRRLTVSDWHQVLDTNLTAAFLLARAAEQPLRKAHGAIVTIASTRALMSEPNTESYSASKGGLVALTHALAISLAPGIRVNWLDRNQGLRRATTEGSSPASGRPRRATARCRRTCELAFGRPAFRFRHRGEFRDRRRHDAQDDL